MSSVREIEISSAVPLNARSEIQKRIDAGRIPWIGPLLLVSARSVLWLTFQCLLGLIFAALHRSSPFAAAGQWWIVYGTLSDGCCLFGMKYFTRREGIRLRDLIGPIRMRRGYDIFFGLGLLVLSYPLFYLGGRLGAWLVYGSISKVPMEFILQRHTLPLWATVYSLTVWWIIQSATEEMTYQGYALPRLEALTGRSWAAMAIVGFGWAAQHFMIPFVPDWHYVAYRFLMFLPLLLFMMPVYLRIRRLSPMIIAHWPMDIGAAIMTGLR
jgi:hypothetical protein